MTRLLSAVVIFFQALPAAGQIQPVTREQLLGAWRLQRVEAVRPNGKKFFIYGEHVSGTLEYLGSGDMVVAWGRADRKEFADRANPTGTDLLAAVEDYFKALQERGAVGVPSP